MGTVQWSESVQLSSVVFIQLSSVQFMQFCILLFVVCLFVLLWWWWLLKKKLGVPQQLRALADFPEGLGSISSTHMTIHNHL